MPNLVGLEELFAFGAEMKGRSCKLRCPLGAILASSDRRKENKTEVSKHSPACLSTSSTTCPSTSWPLACCLTLYSEQLPLRVYYKHKARPFNILALMLWTLASVNKDPFPVWVSRAGGTFADHVVLVARLAA